MNSTTPAEDYHSLFRRIHDGDQSARNEVLTLLYNRVIRLTATVLRGFPAVRQRREVESVANELSLKLIAALDARLSSTTADEFLRFAGTRLRHLLIDQADKYRRHHRLAPTLPLDGGGGKDESMADIDPGTTSHDPAPLAIMTEDWIGLLTRIEELPADECYVVEQKLLWELPQARIAEARGWEPKQVSRLWLSAMKKLLPDTHVPERDNQ